MNLNNIITNFKTMYNEVINFFPEIQIIYKLLMASYVRVMLKGLSVL